MKLNEIKKLIQEEIRELVKEKAVSKAQQQAAGIALAAKRGDIPKSKLKGASKEMEKMPKKDLADFAKTKHKGLPSKKESVNEAKLKFKVGDFIKKKKDGNLEYEIKSIKPKFNAVEIYLDVTGNSTMQTFQHINKEWELAESVVNEVKKVDAKVIASKMKGHKTLGAFMNKVSKMGKVSEDDLQEMLPDYIAGKDISKLFRESVNESGILYKAGIKKYGKEGMTKILQAAGKKASHAEIGAIKDRYEKNKKESVNENKLLKEFDISFWDAFTIGAGFELGRYALEIGLAIASLALSGIGITIIKIKTKVKELIRDRKTKKGAIEGQNYLLKNPIIKELVQATKELSKLQKKKIDKRKKDADLKIKELKKLTKLATTKRQEIAKKLLADIKANKLSREAVEYLADEISYIRNSGYFDSWQFEGKSVNEGKINEVDPRWDSQAQKDLVKADADFSNAILAVDANKIVSTYKTLGRFVKAYVKEIKSQKESVNESSSNKKLDAKTIAKKMKGHKTLGSFADKVSKMGKVSEDDLEKALPDYIAGKDISKLFKESVKEARVKKVTRSMWKTMTDDQKESALLTVFDDPDKAEKWIDAKWDRLPPQASQMGLYEEESFRARHKYKAEDLLDDKGIDYDQLVSHPHGQGYAYKGKLIAYWDQNKKQLVVL